MAERLRARLRDVPVQVRIALALTVAAPLLTFAAVLLKRNGLLSLDTALGALTLQTAWWLSVAALVVSLVVFALSLRRFGRDGVIRLAILTVAIGVCAGFFVQGRAIAVAGPLNVSTDLAEPPAIAGVPGAPQACPGAEAVLTQVSPAQATDALQAAGFAITEAQLFRARGVREGFWFGMRHEAHVRIRPGRTDVRLVARYDRADGGETCRLMRQIVGALQTLSLIHI